MLILSLAALFVYVIDYQYLVSDQTLYLLDSFKKIFPNFCLNDWMVWQTLSYHFTFTPLIVFLSRLGDLQISLLLLYVFLSILLMSALLRLIKNITGEISIFPLVFIIMFYFIKEETSAVKLTVNTLIPTSIAPPFLVMGLAFLLEERYLLTGLFWGLSGFFHINYGYEGFLLLFVYLLLTSDYKGEKKNWFSLLFIFLLTLPNIIPALHYFGKTFGSSSLEANRLAIYIRLSHHYLPAHFDKASVIYDLALLLLGLIEIVLNWREEKVRRVSIINGTILFLCVGAVFFITVIEWLTYIRLHFWRFLPIATLLSLILWSYEARKIFQEKSWSRKISVITILLALGVSSFSPKAILLNMSLVVLNWLFIRLVKRENKYLSFLIYFLNISLLVFIGWLYWSGEVKAIFLLGLGSAILIGCLSLYNLAINENLKVFLVTFFMVVFLAVSGLKPHSKKILGSIGQPEVMIKLGEWAKNNTPPGTLFIAPPDIEGFRLLSQRGLIVNVKSFPKKPEEILEWKRRMLDLVNLPDFPDYKKDEWFMLFLERYENLSPQYFLSLAKKYNCQYLIAYREQPNLFQFVSDSWKLVYENEIYAVFAVPKIEENLGKEKFL